MAGLKGEIGKRLERICTEKCFPFYTTLELTYRCNLHCRHCYVPKDCDDELSVEEIESILDQLVKLGTLNLTLTGGEIFVRRDFFDIAEIARAKGFFLILMTNGTLITTDNVDRVARLRPVGIEISIYGACAETHDFMTRISGSFKRTVEAIKLLVGRGIRVITKTVLMKPNAREREGIENLANRLGATPNINVGIIPGRDGTLLSTRYDPSVRDLRSYFAENDTNSQSSVPSEAIVSCKAGKAVCCISPSGEVFPCLLMPAKLGSLREQTLQEIWYQGENELLNKLRSPITYKSSPCFSCHLRPFCVKCPGITFMETGDPYACSPTARRYARLRAEVRTGGTCGPLVEGGEAHFGEESV